MCNHVKRFNFIKKAGLKKIRFITSLVLAAIIALQASSACFAAGMSPTKQYQIKDRLQNILSSKEFSNPSGKPGLLDTIAQWLKDFIEKYLKNMRLPNGSSLLSGKPLSPTADFMLKALGVLIIAVFFVVLLYFIFKNVRMSKTIKQREDAFLLSTLKDPSTFEQKAFEHYRHGDFKQGIRFLYLALLLKYNERNVIKIDKSKTNRQYLHEILNSGFHAYDSVLEFTRAFNEYWYGNKEITRESFDYWYGKYSFLVGVEKT